MNQYLSLQSVYQDPIHPEFGQPCDTHLTTEDGTVFHVNSELLSRHSTFFNSLFLIGEETGQSTVIRYIKRDIFEIILTYLSTGDALLTTENVMHLLVASDFLMIESLLDKCRKFVLQNKKVEHIVGFFLTANRIKGLGMEHQFCRYLVMCFEKAVMNSMDEACCLPYEELKYFLSHRSLNVSDELTIWSVIEAWVQKDPVDRHPLVPGLLRCLSIDEIDDELGWDIISSPIILNNEFYKDVGDPRVSMGFLSNKIKAQTVILFRNEPPIISEVRLPRLLHVVAKNFQDRDGAELYLSYDDSLDLWRKVGEISLKGSRLLVSGHLVYYLKHVGDGHYELRGSYYDLLRNEEKRMSLPNCTDYVVGEVGGRVYALEMFGTAIQRYVDETDEWMDMGQTRYRVCVSGAQSVNGLLYVLGEIGAGYMFMQVYDPSLDQWCRVAPPTVRRILAKTAVYQGKIFLVAGRRIDFDEEDEDEFDYDDLRDDFEVVHHVVLPPANNEEDNDDDVDEEEGDPDAIVELDDNDDDREESISTDVEVYDPQSNEWVVYPELPFKFFPVFVSVVKDRLYVYKNSRRPVTYWDGSGEWKIAENPSHLFHHKFCDVKDEDVVRLIMKRNKEEDSTIWKETGLDKEIL